MNKLSEYHDDEELGLYADDVLLKIAHAGLQEIYVTQEEMFLISRFVYDKLYDVNKKDELLFRGEVDKLYGIKLLKLYDENKPPEEKKVNEAE